jgi:D-glycero-D-manno-heptose 1,7-bisphosphate phosphatase
MARYLSWCDEKNDRMIPHKAVFVDKDGTLIQDVPYNVDPNLVHPLPFAAEGLKILQKHGYKLFIISNQSGVAKGLFSESSLSLVFDKLQEWLSYYDVKLDGFYYCPHDRAGVVEAYAKDCNCRKPADGLFQRAALERNIDLESSWMIGDILDDVEAGNRAGCRSILINNGNETLWQLNRNRIPFSMADNLYAAAFTILEEDHCYE